MDLIRSAAANLVELKPDAILAIGGRVIPVLMNLTSPIPIVIPGGTDLVARGFVKSLARPGGNVTGFAVMEFSIYGKMLQTLKEIAPHLARVFMIYNPDNPAGAFATRAFEAAAGSLGVEPVIVHIHGLSDIERAVAAAAVQPDGGILVPLDLTISALAEQTVTIVARHRLPAIYARARFRREWRASLLWDRSHRPISRRCILRRSHPTRRKTRRSPISATNQIRSRD